MAKLPDSYFETQANQGASAPVIPAMSTSGSSTPSPLASLPIKPSAPSFTPAPDDPNKPDSIRLFPDLTPEQQKAKFGYEVGSQQYYEAVGKGPGDITPMMTGKAGPSFIPTVANAVGVRLPQGEEWDKMGILDKIATTDVAVTSAAGRMIRDLPKAVGIGLGSVALTAIKPFYNLFTGKSTDMNALVNEPILKVPYLGEVPTLYQDQKRAEESGMGPIASRVFAGSNLVLNASMVLPVVEMFTNTFRPKGPITTAGPVKNTEAIQYSINKETGVYSKAPESASEYYTLRKSDAKQFGGNINDTKWKLTPANDGNTSISVTKSVKGKVGDYIKTDFGLKRIEQGDFGPEVKLYSADVPTVPKTDIVPFEAGATGAAEGKLPPVFILPKERVGLSNRPITPAQIDTLNNISQMKNMDPAIKDAVIKAITGKDSIGSLVEKDYVNVAQTLSKFGEKYGVKSATLGPTGYVQKWLAPQRHYFNYVEDTFGYPLKTQVYDKFERAAQLTKILDQSLQPELDNLFGKYTSPKFVEERRLVDAYARGDQSALTGNKLIDPTVKTELIDIANKLKVWDDTHGQILGVGKEAYLQNYGGPKITNTGGVIPQYKNLETIPSKNFFAKFKREGSLDPFIDDPYASRQIYIKEGSKAMHYGPALENFDALSKSLPPNFLKDANSYVQEKLGRLGAMEKFVDSFVPSVNKKLGINLPADASRQAINYGLSSIYSGLVGTPQSAFKQFFQLPLFVYSRLGTEFAGDAIIKSMDPAFRTRVAKLGYLNDISLPYGAELTKDFSPAGKLGNAYKDFTQQTLKPMTFVDNDVRIKTFAQAEMKWNSAINLYNEGKIDWPMLEQKLDFGAFSKADRNTIRQGLVEGQSGESSNAFTTYMRETIDETSFPYRTGAGARVGFGLTGKLATGLLNYTIESTNVLSKWMTTGQWDKIIRFAGTAKAMDDTMKKQFGFDFSNTFYQKISGLTSPAIGLAGNFYDYMNAMINNQRQTMNDSRDNILKSLRSGMPLGIATKNVTNFYKSMQAGDDGSGQYPIYDAYGKLVDNGDFTDLFWGSLMGFSTVKKTNERNLYNDIKNSQVEETDIRNEINQLLREGKYDEMQKRIEETGITPSQSTMESAYVPRAQRLFQTLSPQLKAKYVPRIFPETVTK